MESELFGLEKGAFPGALHRKKHKFKVAERGDGFSRRNSRHQPEDSRSRVPGYSCHGADPELGGSRTMNR
ncbi:MAG: sigma 54-interacting transcriptional regulator [Terriglobia bacterium]